MIRHILIRFLQAIVSLSMLTVLVFILARATGNPVDLLLPPDATPQDEAMMIAKLGLDRSYPVQFYEYISSMLSGDLGTSIRFGRPVVELYMQRWPNSMSLIGVALLICFVIAIPLGVIAGSHRGTYIDQAARMIAVVGISAPAFWIGLVLMQIFAVNLGILPVARMGGPLNYILPAFSTSFFILAGMTRLLRSSMIEVLDSEFVKLARVKGVSERMVVWKHCLRNALVPVLSFAGMYVALGMGGAIVVETVFAWPGIGRLAYEAIQFRDYPLVQGVVLMTGALIIIINFVVDILYSFIDPRIKATEVGNGQ